MKNIASVKSRLKSTTRWIRVLQAGLDGHPCSLGSGEADAFQKCLAQLDIHFLSKTQAQKKGLTLKRGAKPVVVRYYGAPISGRHPLFCAEQFNRQPAEGASTPPDPGSTAATGSPLGAKENVCAD